MRIAGALAFAGAWAAAACTATGTPAGAALRDLPVLDGTRACLFESSEQSYLCRQFPLDQTDKIAGYIDELTRQGWRLKHPGHGEGIEPPNWEHPQTTLWFERDLSSNCAEIASFNTGQTELANGQIELMVLIGLDSPPVCGAARKPQ